MEKFHMAGYRFYFYEKSAEHTALVDLFVYFIVQ
jgi:hypothetical protein